MGWPKKNPDPLNDRARALNREIAQLEEQIRALDAQVQCGAVPDDSGRPANPPVRRIEDSFVDVKEPVGSAGVPEGFNSPHYYNELGVRKYDLPALLQRVRNHLRGPVASNPRLVSYLAAGGIQGLRPMRYERRVARNRFIALVVFLFLVLLGLLAVFVRR